MFHLNHMPFPFCQFSPLRSPRLCGLFFLFAGCTASPRAAVPVYATRPWQWHALNGRTLETAHYTIHTTFGDKDDDARLATLLENALKQYQQLTPGLALDPRPMPCFFFANRREWAEFTGATAGPTSRVYLRIDRGGYTLRDRFVAYDLGERGTAAVVAHEGFHQFVFRNFKSRLPPFLEEGLATLFENATDDGPDPDWGSIQNAARIDCLAAAQETGTLWPLRQLLGMHAGDVIALKPERVDTFYAQGWAAARFLLSEPALASRFRKMLQACARGASAVGLTDGAGTWTPAAVGPFVESALEVDLDTLDAAYRRSIQRLARQRRPSD